MIDGLPPLLSGFHPMTSKAKQIIDGTMDGKETLRLSRLFKSRASGLPVAELPDGTFYSRRYQAFEY